jgi:hypothetical protein
MSSPQLNLKSNYNVYLKNCFCNFPRTVHIPFKWPLPINTRYANSSRDWRQYMMGSKTKVQQCPTSISRSQQLLHSFDTVTQRIVQNLLFYADSVSICFDFSTIGRSTVPWDTALVGSHTTAGAGVKKFQSPSGNWSFYRGSILWSLIHVNRLAPRILRCLLYFLKNSRSPGWHPALVGLNNTVKNTLISNTAVCTTYMVLKLRVLWTGTCSNDT